MSETPRVVDVHSARLSGDVELIADLDATEAADARVVRGWALECATRMLAPTVRGRWTPVEAREIADATFDLADSYTAYITDGRRP